MTGASELRLGLLGEKLGHSYSPLIYACFGVADYSLFEVPPGDVEAFVRGGGQSGLSGLNVTIPYKKAVLPLCDSLSDDARRLGNVNALRFDERGRIHGHNTDYAGFMYMMRRAGLSMRGRKVVILGSGGAACTARLAALDAGATDVAMISRTGEDNYENLAQRHADAQILVNATPVGMYPDVERSPVSLDIFPMLEGVADAVYNPLRTRLLTDAQSRGLRCAGGLAMLAAQGRASAEFFLGADIPPGETGRVHEALLRSMENIVLIGMPGSGKSCVGRALARAMNRPFVDTDALIAEQAGISPAEIIRRDGEPAFRELETAALCGVAKRGGQVIATGGGAVLCEQNRIALRQNGRVFWLRRPLAALAVDNRPLSKDLSELYAARQPVYRAASDACVDALDSVDQTAKAVMEAFYEHTRAQRAELESAGDA